MGDSHSAKSGRPRGRGIAIAGGLAIAAIAVACAETTASAPAPAAAPAAGANAAGAKPGPPEIGWADMNKDQRIDYMKAVVLPRMRVAFTGFNPDRYGKMNCVSCHGDSAADGSFKMPNPRLPKLPTTPEGFKLLAEEKPAVVEFMKNKVKPTMAQLLGVPEWTPETGSGFGCMDCHTSAQ